MNKESSETDRSFPREARLAKRSEIQRLQRRGKKIHTKSFIIAYEKSSKESSRLALTVSKKVDKRAVVRNTIKRRLRELFRKIRLQLKDNLEVVIIARGSAKECPYSECSRQIIGALKFHKLLKSEQ